MNFNKVGDKWIVTSIKGHEVAQIANDDPFVEVTNEMLPLSTVEILAMGARMIADRHHDTLAGRFNLNYDRVALSKQFLQHLEGGNKDRLDGFVSAASAAKLL